MVKRDYTNIYKPSTRFAGSKRTLRSCTSVLHALPLSKRTLQILHKPPTCFMEVKTDSQNFSLRWSNWTPRSSTSLLHDFPLSKRSFRSSRSLLYDSLCSIWTVGNSTTIGVVSACTSVLSSYT